MSTPFTITFPSLEAAVSTICEKVFGAALVIKAPEHEASEYRLLAVGEEVQPGDERLTALQTWALVKEREFGIPLQRQCHGYYRRRRVQPAPSVREATKGPPRSASGSTHEEVLADKDAAIRHLKELRKEALHEADRYEGYWTEQCAHVRTLQVTLEDKDATIRRLKEKLENLERHVQEEHVATWDKIQKILGTAPPDCDLPLVDRAVERITGLDTEVNRLTRALDQCQSGNRTLAAEVDRLKARIAELETPSAGSDGEDLPAPDPQYRFLEAHEICHPGDEVVLAADRPRQDKWTALGRDFGSPVMERNVGFIRRKIAP